MSIKVMTAVWDQPALDTHEKMVMLALADHANDEGVCYPSIARLSERTGISDRGIQKIVARLIEKQFLAVEISAGRNGVNVYTVHPNPEPCSPPNPVHPRTTFTTPPNPVPETPEPRSPKPSRTTIEPSESNARSALYRVLSPRAADAFIAHRKAKRAKLTGHAAELIAQKLAGHPNPDAVIEASIMQGWTGVFPEKTQSRGRNERSDFDTAHREYVNRIRSGQIQRGPDPSDPFAR